MKLVFKGEVTLGHTCRVAWDDDEPNGYIHIGGRDFLDEIEDTSWSGPVTVAFADQRFTGDLDLERGWGYSEYTPVDSDAIKIGGTEILEILANHEGQELTVWVADEPVNVLEVTH